MWNINIYITLGVCMHAKSLQLWPTLCDAMGCAHQAPHPWDSLGKNSGVDCHAFLQGISLTQGKPVSLMSPAAGFFTSGTTWEA